ncbi:MFS transporter [Phenylobacterium sp. J426]|uniref:MFS transporter n=1 Tax=Phenylobacterium sp. J426 TaxID=2898439 RepID=UPI0027E2E867|nr:MFS transporter [Phenylobacterium sp. J426]
MLSRSFLKAGHPPTLLSAFLYFDLSFMVWVLLGPLGVAIAKDFGLTAAQKGLMVAVPVLSGALLRLVAGVMVDHIGPKRTGLIGQIVVLTGLAVAWLLGVSDYSQVLALGVLLGVAGASFAVALPLASRWYPPEHQGLALGIAGAGNSGTALAALFAPGLAQAFGWQNVIGLAALPLTVALVVYAIFAKDAPNRPLPEAAGRVPLGARRARRLVADGPVRGDLRRLRGPVLFADDIFQRRVRLAGRHRRLLHRRLRVRRIFPAAGGRRPWPTGSAAYARCRWSMCWPAWALRSPASTTPAPGWRSG